jgi:hypothetical protein
MKHYLGLCLVLLTLAAIFFFALRSCTSSVNETVDHVQKAFSEALSVQPEIRVDERVVLTQTAPIAELAVVTKDELVTTGIDEHLEVLHYPLPLTDKKLAASAVYRIKAGFDLREPFSVHIDASTQRVSAQMPHARILSVEQIGEVELHGEDATLNHVTDEERTELLNTLNAAARVEAEKSTLKSEAETAATQRLTDLLHHNGQTLQINWTEISPSRS